MVSVKVLAKPFEIWSGKNVPALFNRQYSLTVQIDLNVQMYMFFFVDKKV